MENLLSVMSSMRIISFRLPWNSSTLISDIKKIINARLPIRHLILRFSLRAKKESIGKIVRRYITMRLGWIFFRRVAHGLKDDGDWMIHMFIVLFYLI